MGLDAPVFAFSHCRDVVAEVSRCGGLGVLGAALFTPDELDNELKWIDERVQGKPYGVDLIVPSSLGGKSANTTSPSSADAQLEAVAREFVDDMLRSFDIDPASVEPVPIATEESLSPEMAAEMIEVALSHPVALMANALGPPPQIMIDRSREAGVRVAALAGSVRHAQRHAESGVDIVVAQGYEAGGHTGEVGTMVLVPEIVHALSDPGSPAVLAAGGIVTGQQVAASVALGAQGAWTGSVWLATHEAETAPYTREKILSARSTDTVRSVFRTGKPSRQLRSAWHDEWERSGSPEALPMPLMGALSDPALRRVDTLAATGHRGAQELSTYWVGQGVGLMNVTRSTRQVITDMIEEYLGAIGRIESTLDD
jgi:NAD(P)H-dependent flavin oxidoreductase YrpB (nitropropane dioxygenase family)